MILDNILKVVTEYKDKIFILKGRGFKGHIVGFKNNLIIVEWETTNGRTTYLEEYSIESLEKYTDIEDPLKIGDIVKIIDDGAVYEYYNDWFEKYNIPYKYALYFRWGSGPDDTDLNNQYKIIAIHKHLTQKNKNLYLIQGITRKTVYLIDEEGIVKC